MKKITVDVKHKQYDIILDRGCIEQLNQYIDTSRKIFILTDNHIPQIWVDTVSNQCSNSIVYKVASGEQSKSFETFEDVCNACLSFKMGRNDLLIALGGGVIGDLGGFVAASYMRGISFVSIPTTTLSQIDSSIGGKVAINLGKVKNIIGAFYHPDKVIIDFNTLSTLPQRHITSGLVEALKAGLIHDPSLFEMFENDDYEDHLEEIIYKSLQMKKWVVEEDEKEQGVRKTLNFGHTIGHGIEAYYNLETYYHGECVALGMLFFIDNEQLKQRVLAIYKKMNLVAQVAFDNDKVYEILTMDKKAHDDYMSVIKVNEVGKAFIEEIKTIEIKTILERNTL